jgi:hypothetical protein
MIQKIILGLCIGCLFLLAFKVPIEEETLLIDNLKNGESFLVDLKSTGCFHNSHLKLRISKVKGNYRANLITDVTINAEHSRFKKNITALNKVQVQELRDFEKELRRVSATKNHCTTVDEFTLSYNTRQTKFIVDNCEWQGFEKLLGSLFKKQAEN